MLADVDNLLHVLAAANVPLGKIGKAIGSSTTQVRKANKRLRAEADYETTCGSVVKHATIDYNGSPIGVQYIDIKPLFLFLSEECPLFGSMLAGLGQNLHAVMYMDATTPGNQLRPDHGRSFEAVYWTLLEMPEHMRHRVANWFTYMYVQVKDLNAAGCEKGELMRFVVNKIWLEEQLHTLGLHFYCRGVRMRLTLAYGGWLADDVCLYELGSCKGQQSRKPCPCCLNVVGRCEPESVTGHPYLVHASTCWDATRFRPTSAEAYGEMCNRIACLHENGATQKRIDEVELSCGIKHQPHSIIFNRPCRELIRFPELLFWDPQHNLLSSGGVGQYIANEVLRQIHSQGLATLAELDAFSATITHPKSEPRLSRTFFQDRINFRPGSHIKAFASETITVFTVLGLYADDILTPANRLTPYLQLVTDFRIVLDYLQLGDDVVDKLDAFEASMATLHRHMVELVPECCKIKPHLMRHLVTSLRKYKKHFNCFGPERKHRVGKAVAAYAYKNVTLTMLVHDVRDLRAHFADPDTYESTLLLDACLLPGLAPFFQNLCNVDSVLGSRSIRTRRRTFAAGEIVLFNSNNQIGAARVHFFLKLVLASGRCFFLCVLDILRCTGGHFYDLVEGHPTFCAVNKLIMHVSYQIRAGQARLISPTVLPDSVPVDDNGTP